MLSSVGRRQMESSNKTRRPSRLTLGTCEFTTLNYYWEKRMNRIVLGGIAGFFAIVAVAMMSADNTAVAGHGKKSDCCEPEPVCCAPEPTCCEPAPTCGGKQGLFARMKAKHAAKKAAKSCCAPEPVCCEPAPCCAPAPTCCEPAPAPCCEPAPCGCGAPAPCGCAGAVEVHVAPMEATPAPTPAPPAEGGGVDVEVNPGGVGVDVQGYYQPAPTFRRVVFRR